MSSKESPTRVVYKKVISTFAAFRSANLGVSIRVRGLHLVFMCFCNWATIEVQLLLLSIGDMVLFDWSESLAHLSSDLVGCIDQLGDVVGLELSKSCQAQLFTSCRLRCPSSMSEPTSRKQLQLRLIISLSWVAEQNVASVWNVFLPILGQGVLSCSNNLS